MQAVLLVWFSFLIPKVSEKTMEEGGGGRGEGRERRLNRVQRKSVLQPAIRASSG